jgi:hypothetical protein
MLRKGGGRFEHLAPRGGQGHGDSSVDEDTTGLHEGEGCMVFLGHGVVL